MLCDGETSMLIASYDGILSSPGKLGSVLTTELYYITEGHARGKKVKPKTWRISAFADAISMTTGPYFSW
jgi:hypothetical protein